MKGPASSFQRGASGWLQGQVLQTRGRALRLPPYRLVTETCSQRCFSCAVPLTPVTIVISECRLSGVSNSLGFFPTIMALSVPVFSVSSICDRCL